jgi:hypothetical protein
MKGASLPDYYRTLACKLRSTSWLGSPRKYSMTSPMAQRIEVNYPNHRPPWTRAGNLLAANQSDELRRHAFDHMDRATELTDRLIQSDPEINLGPLFQRRSAGRGRRLGRYRLGTCRRQRSGGGVGALAPALAIQLRQGGGGGLPGGELIVGIRPSPLRGRLGCSFRGCAGNRGRVGTELAGQL